MNKEPETHDDPITCFQDWRFSNSFKTALKLLFCGNWKEWYVENIKALFITWAEEQEEHPGISCHICACHMLVASRRGAALHLSCLAQGSAQESDKREQNAISSNLKFYHENKYQITLHRSIHLFRSGQLLKPLMVKILVFVISW